ncbi:MAG: HIT domain-containing protein [Candidatus Saccharimonadales bacterium]
MNNPSIFTKIIQGEIPCHKVYEDEQTMAFLDIYSEIEGHTLVISKKQVEFLWDLDQADYRAVTDTAQKVAKRLREVLEIPYVGVKVVGVDVPHAHIHLVPFTDVKTYHKAGVTNREPDHKELAELAKRLAF